MEKQQIDYEQFEKERIISISDLIEEILRKIWVVVVLAVVFALIFGGYKYAADKSAAQAVSTMEEGNVEDTLSDVEQQQVNNVLVLQNTLQQEQEYIEDSILMQINPYMEDRINIQFVVKTNSADVSDAMNNLAYYVKSGALAGDLQEEYPDVSAGYLSELISFQKSMDESGNKESDLQDGEVKRDVFWICVIHSDESSCETLADNVVDCLMKYQLQSEALLGDSSLEVLHSTSMKAVDYDLQDYQTDKTDEVFALQDTVNTKLSALSDSQRMALNQSTDNDTLEPGGNTAESVSVGISKKNLGLGAVAGIILAIIILILRYVIRGTLNLSLEFQNMFHIRVFGQVDLYEKRNVLVTAWRRLTNKRKTLPIEEEKRLTFTNIKAFCNANDIDQILLTGSGASLHEISWLEDVIAELRENGIHAEVASDFPYSSNAMDKILACKAVILVERLRVSRYEDVLNGIKKCLEQNKQIGGAIVLN